MANHSCHTDVIVHYCTDSWLELRSEVNFLFKMMLNAIELFKNNSEKATEDVVRSKSSLKSLLDAKSIEVTLMELLRVVTRIKTLIPASDSIHESYHKHTATGCMTTPYTQTEPTDTYIDYFKAINSLNGNDKHCSVSFSPDVTSRSHPMSSTRRVIRKNSVTSFNDNSGVSTDVSRELRWEKTNNVPKKKKKNNDNSNVKFSVRKSTDTFASSMRDGATRRRRNSDIEFTRNGDCEISFDGNGITINARRNCRHSSSSDEDREFHMPRYLSEIRRVKSKESVTVRSREFDNNRTRRKYFDFEDYYDRIMSHSE